MARNVAMKAELGGSGFWVQILRYKNDGAGSEHLSVNCSILRRNRAMKDQRSIAIPGINYPVEHYPADEQRSELWITKQWWAHSDRSVAQQDNVETLQQTLLDWRFPNNLLC